MKKGKSGQQIAAENVSKVKLWIDERNERRDWHEYEYSKRINRRVLAEELDFAKSVCTQNKSVRDLLAAAEQHWFGKEKVDRSAHEAARERAEKQTGHINTANSRLVRRVAELEAEIHDLRKQLLAFKEQQDLVEKGLAGFKL